MIKLIKTLFYSSIPLIYGGTISTLMTFLDGVYLSHYAKEAFNALILIIPIIGIIGGIGSSLAAATANKLTKSDTAKAKKLDLFIITMMLFIISVVVTLLAIVVASKILSFYTLDTNQLEAIYLIEYWYYIIPSFFIQIILVVAVQLLVIYSKLRTANLLLTIITLINIVLSPILIFTFNLGVIGAAISTNIAYFIGFGYLIIKFYNQLKQFLNFAKAQNIIVEFKSYITPLKQISLDMTMIFFSVIVFSVGNIFFNKLAMGHGFLAITVLGISEQLKSVFVLPSRGVLGAFITHFGKFIKEKRKKEYWSLYWAATFIIALIYIPGALFFIIGRDFIASMYNITDLAIKSYLDYFIIINSILLVTIVISRAAQVSFLCLQKPVLLFLQSIAIVLFSYFGAVYALESNGIKGIVMGQFLGTLLANMIFFILFYRSMTISIK